VCLPSRYQTSPQVSPRWSLVWGSEGLNSDLPWALWRRQLWGAGARSVLFQAITWNLCNFSGHFKATQTLTYSTLGLCGCLSSKNIRSYSLLAVYCMNFIIFLCATLKLFSRSFVPLLAPVLATPLLGRKHLRVRGDGRR